MREELRLNRSRWDRAAEIHVNRDVYGAETFRAGGCRLHRIEREEVGDVRGRSLLHLQCHFGLDTLSWARRGALVTGVDFSPVAIDAARKLSAETNVPGEFICSTIEQVRAALPNRGGSFDIVYTSYGVLCWLPELRSWADAIAHFLKPGGFFYIVEAHPSARMFPTNAQELEQAGGLRPMFDYFHDPAGLRFPAGPDYADTTAINEFDEHVWQHTMADIVNALLGVGLSIDFLHEFPFCAWPVVAGAIEVERANSSQAYYAMPPGQPPMPFMFSLKATKSSTV